MSKLKQAEQIAQQTLESRTETLSLVLAIKLDKMRQDKVATSEELAAAMFPVLQAMTTLAVENQALLNDMRSLMNNEIKLIRAEMRELRATMTNLQFVITESNHPGRS